jgi:hypothetical protein
VLMEGVLVYTLPRAVVKLLRLGVSNSVYRANCSYSSSCSMGEDSKRCSI